MFGFEEEDIMVEALPDAEVDPAAASVAVVTMLAAASADCVEFELRKKKRTSSVSRGCVPGENVPRMGVEPMTLASLNEEC